MRIFAKTGKPLALAALLGTAACGRNEPTVEWHTPAPAPTAITTPTIPESPPSLPHPPPPPLPAAAAAYTNTDLATPDPFPSELPVYTGALIVQVVSTPQGAYAMLRTPAPTAVVMDFYNTRLATAGWTAQLTTTNAGGEIASFTRETRALALVLSRPQDETLISLTLSHPLSATADTEAAPATAPLHAPSRSAPTAFPPHHAGPPLETPPPPLP